MQVGSYSADEMLTIVHNGTSYTYADVPEVVYRNVKLLVDKNATGKIIKLLTPYKIDKSLITRRNLTTMKPPITREKDYEWSAEVANFFGVPRTFDAWVLTYPKEVIALAKAKRRIIGVSSAVPATINNRADLEKDWDDLLVSLELKNKESTMKDEQIGKAIDFLVEEDPLFSNPMVFDDKWLDKHIEGTWKRNSDGKIDVVGNVNISGVNGLEKLPYSFGKVSNDFMSFRNSLTTLEGVPEEVGRHFNCQSNQIISLDYAPQRVGHDYSCSNNLLSKLHNIPDIIKGSFSCGNCQLSTLEGAPKEVEDNFNCTMNGLENLEGGPQSVGNFYFCRGNPLTSLTGAPKRLGNSFTSDLFSDKDYRDYAKENYE